VNARHDFSEGTGIEVSAGVSTLRALPRGAGEPLDELALDETERGTGIVDNARGSSPMASACAGPAQAVERFAIRGGDVDAHGRYAPGIIPILPTTLLSALDARCTAVQYSCT
jgi:hypothetical protein